MVQITEDFKKRLVKRLSDIIRNNERLILTHKNGKKEELTIGRSGDSIFIYNKDPDLIRAFEIEGGYGAYDANLEAAAIWLYSASLSDHLVSVKL